ncbi:unnamed protein product [Staurois parvus]|uniref:Sushi domain-containing protein n=1 Tax=Staurois parvus TaxID=386267 RepID=A0ABN9ECB2_9NEOB|nr:unnamed protein product [Staurois parvus]
MSCSSSAGVDSQCMDLKTALVWRLGKWSGETTICDDQEGHCPNPGIPIGASKVGISYGIENKVTYQCQYGHKMFGSETRECKENKRWSGSEPSCRTFYTYDTPKEVAEGFGSSLAETIEASDKDRVEGRKICNILSQPLYPRGTLEMIFISQGTPGKMNPLGFIGKMSLTLVMVSGKNATLAGISLALPSGFRPGLCRHHQMGGELGTAQGTPSQPLRNPRALQILD